MAELITLKDALAEMKKGEPFDVSFWTADKNRDTGGEIKELKGVTLSSVNYPHAIRKVQLPNNEYRDIHIYLMRTFNGRNVYY